MSPKRPMSASNLTAKDIEKNLESYLENKFKSIDEHMEIKMRQALLSAHSKKKELKDLKKKEKSDKKASKAPESNELFNSLSNVLKQPTTIDKGKKEESKVDKHKTTNKNTSDVTPELAMRKSERKKSNPVPL
jgi:hypothetical protein